MRNTSMQVSIIIHDKKRQCGYSYTSKLKLEISKKGWRSKDIHNSPHFDYEKVNKMNSKLLVNLLHLQDANFDYFYVFRSPAIPFQNLQLLTY